MAQVAKATKIDEHSFLTTGVFLGPPAEAARPWAQAARQKGCAARLSALLPRAGQEQGPGAR